MKEKLSQEEEVIETEMNSEGVFVPVKITKLRKPYTRRKEKVPLVRKRRSRKVNPLEEIMLGFEAGINYIDEMLNSLITFWERR